MQSRLDEMPGPLRSLADAAGRIGGAVIGFDQYDKLIYTNDNFINLYNFDPTSTNHTYKSLVHHGVKIGRIKLDGNISTDDYVAMATALRHYNTSLDFIKSYSDGTQIAHHRQLNGWSVQVRLPQENHHFWRPPNSLAEAIDMANGVSRERRALNALPVGVTFISDRAAIWSNAAALEIMADISPQAQSRLVAWASGNPGGWMTTPNPRDPNNVIVAGAAQIGGGECILILAPQAHIPSLTDAMMAVAGLSQTESAVAARIGAGATVEQVAGELGWTHGSTQALVGGRIYKKIAGLTATSQAGLARLAWRLAAISRRF